MKVKNLRKRAALILNITLLLLLAVSGLIGLNFLITFSKSLSLSSRRTTGSIDEPSYSKTPYYYIRPKLFDKSQSEALSSIRSYRYFQLAGFTYCRELDNSIFDALTHLYPLGGSVGVKNPTDLAVIGIAFLFTNAYQYCSAH